LATSSKSFLESPRRSKSRKKRFGLQLGGRQRLAGVLAVLVGGFRDRGLFRGSREIRRQRFSGFQKGAKADGAAVLPVRPVPRLQGGGLRVCQVSFGHAARLFGVAAVLVEVESRRLAYQRTTGQDKV